MLATDVALTMDVIRSLGGVRVQRARIRVWGDNPEMGTGVFADSIGSDRMDPFRSRSGAAGHGVVGQILVPVRVGA
ncbi:hypothetical protein GT354_46630 [Streptomyces sp. SID3343]|nr:hypothetical protein [Streptomyces sp. SID3343]